MNNLKQKNNDKVYKIKYHKKSFKNIIREKIKYIFRSKNLQIYDDVKYIGFDFKNIKRIVDQVNNYSLEGIRNKIKFKNCC